MLFAYFEAFDQSWKDHLPIEPHWGLFASDRTPKPVAKRLLAANAHLQPPSKPEKPQEDAGKAPLLSSDKSLSVDRSYVASGMLGDIGDVKIGWGEKEVLRFTYEPRGRGPHEWDYKYIDGKPNPEPARQGGVLWLSPANDWGEGERCGYDLRKLKPNVIKWEARCVGDPVKVRFVIGGVNWKWSKDGRLGWVRTGVPHGDTVSLTHLGIKKLTGDWRSFECRLPDPPYDFRRLVGGFGWTMLLLGGEGVEELTCEHRVLRGQGCRRYRCPPPWRTEPVRHQARHRTPVSVDCLIAAWVVQLQAWNQAPSSGHFRTRIGFL